MKATLRNILIFFLIILFILALWYFRSIVVYILVAGVLSIMGRPLVDLFRKIRIRNLVFPQALAALLTLLIIWGLILLFFGIFIPLISKQVSFLSTIDSSKVIQLIEQPLAKFENLMRTLNKDLANEQSIRDFLADKVSDILNVDVIQRFINSSIGVLGNLLIAAFSISFITFFFLKDQHLFFESILMWVPDKYVANVSRALYSIKNLLTRYFIGIIIQSTCIMILITTGMTIAGIEFQQAVVMGLIVGILNVIPYVGPWLGFFIVTVMGIASHINQDFSTVVVPLISYMVIVVAITQLIDNVVFQPVIFSNSVRAHPLEIFVVILAAGFAAGIPGMIFGIPGYTVIRVFAREFFYGFKAVQKITSGLPVATEAEMNKESAETASVTRQKRKTTRKSSRQKTGTGTAATVASKP
ncbi:MAG: AI-2E family transporter [Bacteroidales bacterium]|nr:AI-2E family transporter [Bacteroidales bacterium]